MKALIYRLASLAHLLLSIALRRRREPVHIRFVDVTLVDIRDDGTVTYFGLHDAIANGGSAKRVALDQIYPVENPVPRGTNHHLRTSYKNRLAPRLQSRIDSQKFSTTIWRQFIDQANIPGGYRNAGLKYAGYIASGRNSWCLPSWIWTNAAVVRCMCLFGEFDQALLVGDKLLSKQEDEGGWIVRSDYTPYDEIPIMAPNDSAYIANNACLSLYAMTGEVKYLNAARKCADWIMDSARADGLVWTGYDKKSCQWIKKHTIVDTGFTAGLFAKLCLITGDIRYRKFLERFVDRFVELFFDPKSGSFATSIDEKDVKVGGRFARGQAWALEGLIPAYVVLRDESIKGIIEASVDSLLREQLPNGGWAYNFDRAYYGEDCKGVPVIAKSLMEWHAVVGDDRLLLSARRALEWCITRTSLSGEAAGGIFSFNLEGAVVHNLYTETAFVYSSAYALETFKMMRYDD